MDPFAGNNSDPQSLHKYLYCHNNPINHADPSGNSIGGILVGTLNVLSVAGIIMTAMSLALKALQIGFQLKQLKELGDFMIELNRAPIPDLIMKLQIRNLVVDLAINLLMSALNLTLEIIRIGITILAFSILLRATIGFLRSMKHAAQLSRAARASAPITDPSRLLPAPKINKHHLFPQQRQFARFFEKAKIKINDYCVPIERTTHLKGVHGKGLGKLPGKWNATWQRFFTDHPSPTALQIFQQAGKMMDEFGLSDLPIVPY